MRLTDRVALITGAARGIGRAIACRFAADGAAVALDDLDLAGVEQLAAEIEAAGGQAVAFGADITKTDEVTAMVDATLDRFGQVDILVNNAALLTSRAGLVAPLKDMPEEVWKRILDVNIHGTIICTQAVLPHMIERRYGKIINFGSIAGVCGLPNWAAYGASKGAIIALTQTLAMEVGEYGLNVNCVSPGIIGEGMQTGPTSGTWLGRTGLPDEVAALVAFLASDEASYITGVNYLVDGGRVLGPHK